MYREFSSNVIEEVVRNPKWHSSFVYKHPTSKAIIVKHERKSP